MNGYMEIDISIKKWEKKTWQILLKKPQRDLFLSLTRLFVEGFGQSWDRNFYIEEFDRCQTIMRFHGDVDWLREQRHKIEVEMMKLVKDSKWSGMKQKVQRLMRRKVDKTTFDESAKWDKFVAGLALFNILLSLDIETVADGELRPDN